MSNQIFENADILLYNGSNKTEFSVIACDQYTSEPKYWQQVKKQVADNPSSLNLIFPEVYLKSSDFNKKIASINASMIQYLQKGIFEEEKNTLIYVERTLKNGKIRHGIVGKIDLEAYDYQTNSQSPVRATEKTVTERIPPRVKIRENAPIELSHAMLLIDDPQKTIIEPLATKKAAFQQAYSFPLMKESGNLNGYFIPQIEQKKIFSALNQFSDQIFFDNKYNVKEKKPLVFAVGDGNHSLATARQCYLNLKKKIGAEKALRHPARYALCEVVNLQDDSLEFEAIHRVLFGIDPQNVIKAFEKKYHLSDTESKESQKIEIVVNDSIKTVYIENPLKNLSVGSLQLFLDEYLQSHSGEIDYIHGKDVVKSLCQQKGCIGFLLPPMDKKDLFKTVILDGTLPRKTFSMGEACDKRFYFEARKIK